MAGIFIWVIGSPRSGTSYVTDLIGRNVDFCFNEPETAYPRIATPEQVMPDTHQPFESVDHWNFEHCAGKSIVLKYCENYQCAPAILARFPNSCFIHVKRCPLNVVNSFAFPKTDSKPFRSFSVLGEGADDRIRSAIRVWYEYITGCDKVKKLGCPYLAVRYERIDRRTIERFLGIPLHNDIPFVNRNEYPLDFLNKYFAEDPKYHFLKEIYYQPKAL